MSQEHSRADNQPLGIVVHQEHVQSQLLRLLSIHSDMFALDAFLLCGTRRQLCRPPNALRTFYT